MLQQIPLDDQINVETFWDVVDFNNTLATAEANAASYELSGHLRQLYINQFMRADTFQDWLDNRASQRKGIPMF
jgi:hypothetical protein